MPTTAESPRHADHSAVLAYYRTAGGTLLNHLAGRPVRGRGTGWGPAAGPVVTLHIEDAADLDEAVRSGVVTFLLQATSRAAGLALHIRAGQDSGIDTVATTTLALMELMEADGVRATAMVDGAGGLLLVGVGAQRSAAARYARELAERSPEMATTTETDSAGRALIEPLLSDSDDLPAPYSLVDGPAGLAVIAPLTRDEVAAATAGMPLDIDLADVLERLRTRGDLALGLTGGRESDA